MEGNGTMPIGFPVSPYISSFQQRQGQQWHQAGLNYLQYRLQEPNSNTTANNILPDKIQ